MDIETANWTDFLVGGFYDGKQTVILSDEKSYFEHLLNFKGTIWGHNAGFFDSLWFISCLQKADEPFKVDLAGSRVLRVRARKMVLQDSFALIPMALEKAGSMVGEGKRELPFGFDKFGSLNKEEFSIVVDYLEQDCILLWKVLKFLESFGEEHNIILRATIGASGWASAREELGLENEKWSTGEWKFARKGYYGGRVEVYRTTSKRGWRYDRNSSYPAALVRTYLPIGSRALVAGNTARQSYTRNVCGIYQARVETAESLYPILPYRTEDTTFGQKGRLIFPVGEFVGVWTGLELQAAEDAGYKIIDIPFALVWSDKQKILAPWCQRIWDLRHQADSTGLDKWLKWLMNSLTGKLAQRAEQSRIKFGEKATACTGGMEPKQCENGKEPCPDGHCCEHRCVGKCGRWDSLDDSGRVWSKKFWRIPSHAHPHWSAYLTSEARLSLHTQLERVGTSGVYCDTDSVVSEVDLDPRFCGDLLGQWKLEGRYSEWFALAPKLYRFYDPESESWTVRGKGFPGLDKDGFDGLRNGQTLDLGTRPQTFKTGLKKGKVWSRRELRKQIHPKEGWIGARLLNSDGVTTRAPTIEVKG
jgi:hypothetical protein